ncbi:hypothetical protein [Methanocella arvoryzae]|uniref:hypothetical protein n=1 Tax=Methanocella arvoryzae TaxID=1175445 RepID=UPI0003215C45|nr:hypothetical protein [Methanocella arvoryzae]
MSLKNQPGNPKVQAVIDLLRKEHPSASIETVSYDGDTYELIIEHETIVYFVGIKLTRANMQTAAKLSLYAKTIGQRFQGKKVAIKLFAPAITTDAKAALIKAGWTFQKLPTGKPRGAPSDAVKITSPGSWKVVCYFLRNEEATMNKASVDTGVSYPWARAVIKKLVEIGAFKEEGRKVSLASLDRLFEYVVWERPINSLRSLEFCSAYEDEQEALHELYSNVSGIIPSSACALFTASDLYLEGVASGGCIQLYADENAALVVKSLLGEGCGVSFQIYSPDREMEDIHLINDIRVVSPEQTILDLAGLGPYGAASAKVIVDYYRKISRQN